MSTREKDLIEADARYAGWFTRDQARVAFADGCAHREQQVTAWLRAMTPPGHRSIFDDLADAIERGEYAP